MSTTEDIQFRITTVVDGLDKDLEVDLVAEHTLQHSITRIREQSSILRDMELAGKILIKGAMYDVASGKVRFLP